MAIGNPTLEQSPAADWRSVDWNPQIVMLAYLLLCNPAYMFTFVFFRIEKLLCIQDEQVN